MARTAKPDNKDKHKVTYKDIIAERVLEYSSSEGEKKIRVKIFKPYKESACTWCCPFRISGLGCNKVRHVYGIDGIQALLFALQMVGMFLSDAQEHNMNLTFCDSSDLGFPLPESFSKKPSLD